MSIAPFPLRLPDELDAALEELASKLHLSKADAARFALSLGVEHVRRIHYDVAGAVLDKAAAMKRAGQAHDTPSHHGLNEAPMPYRVTMAAQDAAEIRRALKAEQAAKKAARQQQRGGETASEAAP